MVVVNTDEGRGQRREVYAPSGDRGMAHHSYLSPDRRWVLLVEMDSRAEFGPCRIAPFEGSGDVRVIGPPNSACTSGAWSPDGKWVYLTANKGNQFHIWRQRFPSGEPEQVTSGPTSQESVEVAADGKSLITSVGSKDSTVWLRDMEGDHQISSEGNATAPSFSWDGNSLYYLMANGQTPGYEAMGQGSDRGKSGQGPAGLFHGQLFSFPGRKGNRIHNERPERPFEPVGCPNQPSLFPEAHLLHRDRRFSVFPARW